MEEHHAIDRLGVAIADHVRDTKSRWSDEMNNAWNAAADEHRNMLLELNNIKTIAFHLGEDKFELQSRVTELEALVGANEHRWAAELNERVYRIAQLEDGIRQHLMRHENGCAYLSHLVAPNK